MAFDSFDAFLAMGGHGPYVWACYFVFFALCIVLVIWSRYQRRSAMRGVARRESETGSPASEPATADFARVESTKR